MMPAHRREVLAEVRRRLESEDENKPPCLLVSTQCIEAGVDVDFPEAWRAFGPYDSIVQAAGRCNRNGRARQGTMHIFHPEDEKYPEGLYRTATAQTKLLEKMGLADPHNPESFQHYFRLLYQLSVPDDCAIQKARGQFHFEEVDELFRFIEDNTVSVLILTQRVSGAHQDTPAKATYDAAERRGFFLRDDWRKLQSCIVNIPFHSLGQAPYKESLMPAFDKDSGLWVWNGIYRGGPDGYGLDFGTIPAEEMVL